MCETSSEVRVVDIRSEMAASRSVSPTGHMDSNGPSTSTTSRIQLLESRRPHFQYFAEHHDGYFYLAVRDGGRDRLARVEECRAHEGATAWAPFLDLPLDASIQDFDVFAKFLLIYERRHTLPQLRVVPLPFLAHSPQHVPDPTDQLQPHPLPQPRPGEFGRVEQHLVVLPSEIGSVELDGNEEFEADKFRFVYSTPITPDRLYEYDPAARRLAPVVHPLRLPSSESKPNLEFKETEYVCKQEWIDGRVPQARKIDMGETNWGGQPGLAVTIVHHKYLILDSRNPTLLIVDGGRGKPLEPRFREEHVPLLVRGWVVALIHPPDRETITSDPTQEPLPQTEELKWKAALQHVIACAEYLIHNSYTSPELLTAESSHIGARLLVEVVNARPQLFQAFSLEDPFLYPSISVHSKEHPVDPFRSHLSEDSAPEGTARRVDSFVSGQENILGQYPHLLVTNRRSSLLWQSAKFLAYLRSHKNERCALWRVLPDPTMDTFHNLYQHKAFNYAFLFKSLGLEHA
jgi:oligopeptidase B